MIRAMVGVEKIVNRYVTAIFKIAEQGGDLKSIAEDFEKLRKFCKECSDSIIKISSPVIPKSLKILIVAEIAKKLKLNDLIKDFLVLVINNGRFIIIAEITEAFFIKYNEHLGVKKIMITTSVVLDEAKQNKLLVDFKGVFGKKIELEFLVNEKIIGGILLKIGSNVFDTSIYGKLKRLENQSVSEILNM